MSVQSDRERGFLHDKAGNREPLYDLDTKTWDKYCPCIRAEQRDPDCPWHGRDAALEAEQPTERSTTE